MADSGSSSFNGVTAASDYCFYVESQDHLNYPNLPNHFLKLHNGKIRNLTSLISKMRVRTHQIWFLGDFLLPKNESSMLYLHVSTVAQVHLHALRVMGGVFSWMQSATSPLDVAKSNKLFL